MICKYCGTEMKDVGGFVCILDVCPHCKAIYSNLDRNASYFENDECRWMLPTTFITKRNLQFVLRGRERRKYLGRRKR